MARLPGVRAVGMLISAMVVVFCADALLFRTRRYVEFLEPESSAAHLQRIILNPRNRNSGGADKLCLAVGDSRMGFFPRIANEATSKDGLRFASAALGGTSPRVWYYLLRELDPSLRSYACIIIPLDKYDDVDTGRDPDPSNQLADLNFILPLLRLRDAGDLSLSFPVWTSQWYALRASIFKGFIFKRDVQAFLDHPKRRVDAVKLYREHLDGAYFFQGDSVDLKGLTVDWAARRITSFPDRLDANMRRLLEERLFPLEVPQTGNLALYRRQWLGRIVSRYSGSNTWIVFIHLPRGPSAPPGVQPSSERRVINEFALTKNVIVTNEHAFEALERPEYFRDPLHLSWEGATQFSQMVAQKLQDLARSRRNE